MDREKRREEIEEMLTSIKGDSPVFWFNVGFQAANKKETPMRYLADQIIALFDGDTIEGITSRSYVSVMGGEMWEDKDIPASSAGEIIKQQTEALEYYLSKEVVLGSVAQKALTFNGGTLKVKEEP